MTETNSTLWRNYERFAYARGRLVVYILSQKINVANASILDFGCGMGGVSIALACQGADVTAIDSNPAKIKHLGATARVRKLNIKTEGGSIHKMAPSCFDAIVLVDVLEHVLTPQRLLTTCNHILKNDGIIYISTPNKYSPLNCVCDPHFSLPYVALLKRKNVKKITADVLKWQPKDRLDFPQLFSLPALHNLIINAGFTLQFCNREVLNFALRQPESIWNRPAHLKFIRLGRKIGMDELLQKIVTNKLDFFNKWLNPTWYMILQK